ncbi:hypothetical protein Tco_1262604 [Tanacetum coccineum]
MKQFWYTVKQVADVKETIMFNMDQQVVDLTLDMFCTMLQLPQVTTEKPFVPPVKLITIQDIFKIVGCEGPIPRSTSIYIKNLTQLWQTLFKVLNRCTTSRMSRYDQTKLNVLKMFHVILNKRHVDFYPSIPKRVDEPYHNISDDTPISMMFTTGDLLAAIPLRIPDDLLTKDIRQIEAYKSMILITRFKNVTKKADPIILVPTVPEIKYDQLTKAQQVSIVMDKSDKEVEAKENIATVEKAIMAEEVKKLVEGDDEVDEQTFVDSIIVSQEDLVTRYNAPNPTKVKTGTCPRAAHEVPLLIATATRVIAMEDATGLSNSSGTPSNEDSPRRITESDGTENQGQETIAPEVHPQENVLTVGVTPEIGLEKEVAAMGPLSSIWEKSTRLETGSTLSAPTLQETPADVSDLDPLSYAKLQSIPEREIAQSSKGAIVAGDPDSEKSTSFTSFTGSPSGIYQPGWGRVTEKVVKRDQRIQAREEEIKKLDQEIHSLKSADTEVQGLRNQMKNLKALLEAEVDMKKATEAKNEDDKVEQWCVEMDACLDKLSIDFDEEFAESLKIRQAFANVVSARIAKGMSEGLQYGIEHGKAGRDLGDVKAYDPKANGKFIKALQDMKDLKHPISDTGEDAPQWIRDLRPSSSQLKIPIYPEVCDPKDPWVVKEEISLEDAIAANVSRTEKKKKFRVVCHTHGVGSAHHARPDGVALSVPTADPYGLAILLTDTTTQTKGSEGKVSSRLIRSKSLPPMFNSEWP